MAEDLASILSARSWDEPPEVGVIKQFVRDKYKSEVGVAIREQQIIITVRGAALAGALRMNLYALKKLCETKKRLVIRIN